MMGSFSILTGYQHFQSGTLMPVGEKGSIPLLQSEHENKWQQWGKNLSGGSWPLCRGLHSGHYAQFYSMFSYSGIRNAGRC